MATALNVSAWSTTAASNDGADSTIGTVANTSSPTNVDDWVRGIMASVKRYILDTDGGLTSGGTANAQTLATNRNLSSGHQAAGLSLRFKAGATNTGATTLNVDSLGAVAVKRLNGDDLSAGDIVQGGIYDVAHDGTYYVLLGTAVSGGSYGTLSGSNTWSGENTFSSTVTMTGAVTVGDGSGDTVVIKGTTVNSYMSGLLSTSSASNLRTALGLGTAATKNTGTSGATIPLLNAENTWSAQQGIAAGTATGLYINKTVSSNAGLLINKSGPQSDTYIAFQSGGSGIGSITGDSDSVQYNQTSDGRLKPECGRHSITDAGSVIDALSPIRFMWRGGKHDFGFIAQEVHAILPEIVTPGSPDDISPDDEDFKPWMMQYGRLEPFIIAELQSLRRRVAAMEGA